MTEPRGELALRTLAMPADTNPAGDIFGGWIMSLMDIAAGMSARTFVQCRTVTKAVSNLTFLAPVKVGDTVCCYTERLRTGRTSVTYAVETWAIRVGETERVQVTQAEFTMVALDEDGRPTPILERA